MDRTRTIMAGVATWVVVLALALTHQAFGGATITIVNEDGPNEGFNDPTPVAPIGGNPGTTLGEQRLNCFEFAASIYENLIDSDVEIRIAAAFDPLTCTIFSAILGSAGPVSVFADFPNAPVASTWYHGALADSLAGIDLDPGTADIVATFNSNLDGSIGCLFGTQWYLGFDNNPPGADVDLLVVLLHEFAHGLAFATFVDESNGALLADGVSGSPCEFGCPDIYAAFTLDLSTGLHWDEMTDAQRAASAVDDPNLVWDGPAVTAASGFLVGGMNGGFVRLHAPNPVQPGSSISHCTGDTSPNLLMEPVINTDLTNDVDLTIDQFVDVGWRLAGAVPPCLGLLGDLDSNGYVDIADYAVFQRCAGLATPNAPECVCLDMDGNGIVDFDDFPGFAAALYGPNVLLGACCDDGIAQCVESAASECTAPNQTYQGDGIACAQTTCTFTPRGACCDPTNGSCTEVTQADCDAAGGLYQGDATLCASGACSFVGQYSNDDFGLTIFQPGADVEVADDMTLASSGSWDVVRYTLTVAGTSGPSFSATASLYSDCPGNGGTLIPGTTATWNGITNDGFTLTNLIVDLPPVTIPNTVWMVVSFTHGSAGWMVGEQAEIGETLDLFAMDQPPWACNFTLIDHFAGFRATLETVPVGSSAIGSIAPETTIRRVQGKPIVPNAATMSVPQTP